MVSPGRAASRTRWALLSLFTAIVAPVALLLLVYRPAAEPSEAFFTAAVGLSATLLVADVIALVTLVPRLHSRATPAERFFAGALGVVAVLYPGVAAFASLDALTSCAATSETACATGSATVVIAFSASGFVLLLVQATAIALTNRR